MRSVLFYLLVVLFSHGKVASQKFNLISIKTLGITCFDNPDLLVNVTCKLKPINWEKTIAVMDADIVGVIRNASFHIQLFKWTHSNQFRPFLVNVTTNICNILDTGRGNPYAKVALNLFKRFSSINHKCPYSGHVAARNIYFDTSFIPFGFPSGKYKIKIMFYEGWPMVQIGGVEVIIDVVENAITDRSTPKKPKNKTGNFVRGKILIHSTVVQNLLSEV